MIENWLQDRACTRCVAKFLCPLLNYYHGLTRMLLKFNLKFLWYICCIIIVRFMDLQIKSFLSAGFESLRYINFHSNLNPRWRRLIDLVIVPIHRSSSIGRRMIWTSGLFRITNRRFTFNQSYIRVRREKTPASRRIPKITGKRKHVGLHKIINNLIKVEKS
jgi:hypothetical protein